MVCPRAQAIPTVPLLLMHRPLTHQGTVLLQGISPLAQASFTKMQAYGTPVAGMVQVGQGGQTWQNLPVFDLVEQAIASLGSIQTSLIFVPPAQVADAALEAIAAGIRQLILVPADVPPLDTLEIIRAARATQTVILGAGSAGLIVPDRCLLGTLNPHCYTLGSIGIIDRTTAHLGEAIAWELTQAGLGQSMFVHLGVGNILGSTFADWLPLFEQNEQTQAIVLLEQHLLGNDTATDYLTQSLRQSQPQKPIYTYIAGQKLPQPSQPNSDTALSVMHQIHALPHTCTAAHKKANSQTAQIRIARSPRQLTEWLRLALKP